MIRMDRVNLLVVPVYEVEVLVMAEVKAWQSVLMVGVVPLCVVVETSNSHQCKQPQMPALEVNKALISRDEAALLQHTIETLLGTLKETGETSPLKANN